MKKISSGVAHDIPDDLLKALNSDKTVLEKWEDLTPLARNEWICWTVTNKKSETRAKHIKRITIELVEGKRRPCCWSGCPHRTDKKINATQKWVLKSKK